MKTKDFALQVKDLSEDGTFEGYASTFGGAPDSYGDVISPGAFALSLAKHRREGTMPLMLFGHDASSLPVGNWVDMAEDGKGLRVKGELALDDPVGLRVHSALKAKRVRGLSIGYRVKNSHADEKRPGVNYLDEIELFEASIVNFAANPRARVEAIKECLEGGHLPTLSEFEKFLREAGFSKTQSAAIANRGLAHLLRSESEGEKADLAVAALRAAVAGFLTP